MNFAVSSAKPTKQDTDVTTKSPAYMGFPKNPSNSSDTAVMTGQLQILCVIADHDTFGTGVAACLLFADSAFRSISALQTFQSSATPSRASAIWAISIAAGSIPVPEPTRKPCVCA